LFPSYWFASLSGWRHEQALPGFAKFFRDSADSERDHALKLAHYQARRGGRVVFQVTGRKKILLTWREEGKRDRMKKRN
jgi:ferritin